MKKFNFAIMTIMLVAVLTMTLCACGLFGGDDDPTDDEPKEYTIQYTDDDGPHTLKVTEGEPYALETIPARRGYVFTGLYDAETGGTRYVNAQGASLSVYSEGKSMVLFPQFEPLKLTLVLDCGEATYNGQRQIEVTYDDVLPSLPSETEIYLADHEFVGWYTGESSDAKQLTDSRGNAIANTKIDHNTFTISGNNITLYARFEPVDHIVTLVYSQSEPAKQVGYKHGEVFKASDITLLNNGLVVTSWSTERDDTLLWHKFEGAVTEDITLYAARWSRSATYTRDSQELVGSDGFGKEFSEYPNLKSVFGKSIEDLKAAATGATTECGYIRAEIELQLTLHEIDDGYQSFRVSNSGGKHLYEKEFTHTSGKKDPSTATYTFKFSVGIDDLTDNLTIDYDARGQGDDDWILEKTVMKITLYQE